MIYNLVEYLRVALPTERIYANLRVRVGSETNIPARNVLVIETGGPLGRVLKIPTFQILVRDEDMPKARVFAYSVQTLLHSDAGIGGRFGQILPQVTVGGTLFPSVQVAQISAIAEPQSIGFDDDGYAVYSQNYQIFTED
jgi:hypothetical protein